MKKISCPLSEQICSTRIKNLQSNPKGFALLKKYLKVISKKGVIVPNLFFNKNIDFAFFPRPNEELNDKSYKINDVGSISEMRAFAHSISMHNTGKIIINKANQMGYFVNNQDTKNILDFGSEQVGFRC